MTDSLGDIPYAKELDPHVVRKGSLESSAHLEIFFVPTLVHGVRERQLFDVALGEKSNFMNHASEGASRVSTTREPENANLVPGTI